MTTVLHPSFDLYAPGMVGKLVRPAHSDSSHVLNCQVGVLSRAHFPLENIGI